MNYLSQLKEKFTILWTRFRAWVELWPDVWAQNAGIAVFILSAPLFGWIANQFGGVESGILQNLIIVAVEISFINALIFLGILLNYRVVFDWYKKKPAFIKDWFNLSPWQRFTTFLVLYCSLFLAGVLLLASLQ